MFASAGGSTGAVAAVSNAIPPIRIDKTDCVCTVRPLADSDTSIPLACQKRVFGLTYWSYGARTNILTVRNLPSLSSSYDATSPTCSRRKIDRGAGVE